MCVAPPTHVGEWSMALLLRQPFEYYYYYYAGELLYAELEFRMFIMHVQVVNTESLGG